MAAGPIQWGKAKKKPLFRNTERGGGRRSAVMRGQQSVVRSHACNPRVKIEMAAFASRCFPKTIDIPVGLRHQPLEARPRRCRMSARLADVLRKSGIRVLGDLHGRKVGDFAWERNCGFQTLHELDCLASAFAGATADEPMPATEAGFSIPESVCRLRFDELPTTTRLAKVVGSIGLRTLGDLNGRSVSELLQCKGCGWKALCEIEQLIERAISGEFDVAQIEEHTAVAELLSSLEQGMAMLSHRERQFLIARIWGLSFAEIGRRCGLTRARVHKLVSKALDTLTKRSGPRVPRLLEMVKRRWLSAPNASGVTPALLAFLLHRTRLHRFDRS